MSYIKTSGQGEQWTLTFNLPSNRLKIGRESAGKLLADLESAVGRIHTPDPSPINFDGRLRIGRDSSGATEIDLVPRSVFTREEALQIGALLADIARADAHAPPTPRTPPPLYMSPAGIPMSQKARRVLHHAHNYIKMNAQTPSLRKIAESMGYKGSSPHKSIEDEIEELVAHGWVRRHVKAGATSQNRIDWGIRMVVPERPPFAGPQLGGG